MKRKKANVFIFLSCCRHGRDAAESLSSSDGLLAFSEWPSRPSPSFRCVRFPEDRRPSSWTSYAFSLLPISVSSFFLFFPLIESRRQ